MRRKIQIIILLLKSIYVTKTACVSTGKHHVDIVNLLAVISRKKAWVFYAKLMSSTFASNYAANEKEVFDIRYFDLFFINLS